MMFRLALIIGLLFLAGAILMVLGHITRRPDGSQMKRDWLKFGVYLAIVSVLMLIGYWGRLAVALVLFIIAFGGAVELYHNLRRLRPHPIIISNLFFLILFLALGHMLLESSGPWYSQFAFVFLLVSATDSFSQLTGRLLGRHRLCPSLSPGKTVEGLFGGLISALLLSSLLNFLMPDITIIRVQFTGLVIAVSAVIGDLIFSYIKRRIGIKDFSGLLPGHGGILDRFDSLIAAAPVSYWAWKLIIR
jgi:phosphatidate cytidylyltransferase